MVSPAVGGRRVSPGVPFGEVRAAVALARCRVGAGGDGDEVVTWAVEVWARLWARLRPGEQEVVYLHVLVGLTHREIADQLGTTRRGVTVAWGRALAGLRDAVPRAG